jgi:diaminohydroxyphosphoribosylaminopyrimidine deaminase/5-amino-6-(5-phosphoribosylamino)uracil reductase
MDPNPAHAGRGINILRDAGVHVEMADEEFQSRATRRNFIFNHNITTGNALVALKLAESANGMLAEVKGQPSRITEDEARTDMMNWRRLFPAICVGSGTVLADNPTLTARLPEETFCPVRLVLDASLSTLEESVLPRNLYTDEYSAQTKVLTTALGIKNEAAIKKADELGIVLIEVGHDENGRIQLAELSRVLKQLNLNAVYCEGGAGVAQSLLGEDLVDYLFRYQSPKLFSGPDALPGPDLDTLNLREPITAKLGEDRLTHGFL